MITLTNTSCAFNTDTAAVSYERYRSVCMDSNQTCRRWSDGQSGGKWGGRVRSEAAGQILPAASLRGHNTIRDLWTNWGTWHDKPNRQTRRSCRSRGACSSSGGGGGLINLRWVRWPPAQAGEYGGELMDGWMMEQDSGDGGLAIWPFSPVWMAEWTGASRWGHFLRPHVGPADCWSQDSREFDLSIPENSECDPASICRTADSRPDSGITLCVRLQFQFH